MLRSQQNYKTNLIKHLKPKLRKEVGLKLKGKTKNEKGREKGYFKAKAPRLDFLLFPLVKSITIQ